MSRRRYRYVTNAAGDVVSEEVDPGYTGYGDGTARVELMLDGHYEGLQATDGTPIDTRRRHQEYMRRNGVAMADDFRGVWARAAEHRADLATTGGDHAARRRTIERVIHQLAEKGRAK